MSGDGGKLTLTFRSENGVPEMGVSASVFQKTGWRKKGASLPEVAKQVAGSAPLAFQGPGCPWQEQPAGSHPPSSGQSLH